MVPFGVITRRSTARGSGWRRRLALAALVVLAVWLLAGIARAPRLAGQAFVPPEGIRVDDLETIAVPALPPLFLAHVRGEAYLGARFWTAYGQYFLVEPVTGWVLPLTQPCQLYADPKPSCATWELSSYGR